MKQILVVDVNPRGLESASRKVARKLEERLKAEYPSGEIVHRDLVVDSLPRLDRVTLKATSKKDSAEAERLKPPASLSDNLTDELLASDLLVIATPMWNFGIPSALKAWIDLVVRPGRTFKYTDGSVLVLARGKKAILVLASGGVFTEGPWKFWDFVQAICVRF
jgi:FMN-dependent NADH-azoreductase